jgi:hypothetical protein
MRTFKHSAAADHTAQGISHRQVSTSIVNAKIMVCEDTDHGEDDKT